MAILGMILKFRPWSDHTRSFGGLVGSAGRRTTTVAFTEYQGGHVLHVTRKIGHL